MFQQQGSEDVGPILGFDLVRNDHLLHHLVGDARQGLLVQVQQYRTCGETRASELWFTPNVHSAQQEQDSVTVGDGFAQLQQTAEGQ